MGSKVEHRAAWNGETVLVVWDDAERSAELLISKTERIGLIYAVRRGGHTMWFDLEQPEQEYRSAYHAIDAVLHRHFGPPQRRRLL
jgi:hypothetical protein